MQIHALLSLALMLITGILLARLSNLIKLPSVTGYIIAGIISGPYVLRLITKEVLSVAPFISTLVLSLIAYTLGPNFKIKEFKKQGKSVILISLGEVVGAFVLVTLASWLIGGLELNSAMILGALAPATAPAAIVLVVREFKAKGELTDTLLRVVAIDDAWGIMLFAIVLALNDIIGGSASSSIFKEVTSAFLEILGSIGIGVAISIIIKLTIKFIKSKTQLLITILAAILVSGGISEMLHFSPLLAGMALGATNANLIREKKIFNIIEGFDAPFYILFFVLAGAKLELSNLLTLGILGIIYVFTRLPGEMIGAYVGALFAKASSKVRKYLGLALAPQAGVAIGLAIIASQRLKNTGNMILATIIVTTIIYEIIGPILVKIALSKAREIQQ